jgi:hypothetical protein
MPFDKANIRLICKLERLAVLVEEYEENTSPFKN